jgi:hypothetical protein
MEHAVYFWTALVGCTLLVLQIVLQVIGLGDGGHVDAGGSPDVHVHFDADHGDPAHGTSGNVFFGLLSFKALVSFAGIFGLTGLSLWEHGLSQLHRISISLLAGLAAMVVVAYLMRVLHNLGSSGSLVLANALGQQATVYLRIPPHGEGPGKVTVEIQGRTLELPAVTDGAGIPTGKVVRVVEVLANETLKVVPVQRRKP